LEIGSTRFQFIWIRCTTSFTSYLFNKFKVGVARGVRGEVVKRLKTQRRRERKLKDFNKLSTHVTIERKYFFFALGG
jgi:hypothetical protein